MNNLKVQFEYDFSKSTRTILTEVVLVSGERLNLSVNKRNGIKASVDSQPVPKTSRMTAEKHSKITKKPK